MVKTPIAKDADNSIVFASTAARKRKYVCLECSTSVVVHRGPIKVPHFTHLNQTACKGESDVHKSTKEWIKLIASRPEFSIQCVCYSCLNLFTVIQGTSKLKAVVECRSLSFVVDVALFREGKVAGFVEVFYSHKTGDVKRKELESVAGWQCPVVEVNAVDLVKENYPLTFQCISPRRCKACLSTAIKKRREEMSARYTAWFRKGLQTMKIKKGLICSLCHESTTKGKWCSCKRSAMAKCFSCAAWQEKAKMHRMLPRPGDFFAQWGCAKCTVQCLECAAHFPANPAFPYAKRCFRCNYFKKNNAVWSPTKDGFPDGFCVVCSAYIKSTIFNEKCYKCNKFP